MFRSIIVLALIFSATNLNATSGRKYGPEVYTVDAFEINWYYHWQDEWQGMQKVEVAKISFCQLIYWNWVPNEHLKKVPRQGWASHSYTMFDVKDETKNGKTGKIREVKDYQTKVTYPTKNWNDGYWYVTVKDGNDTIKVRAKILIGGSNGTDTLFDPEAKDRNMRAGERPSPMAVHKQIIKSRQDAMKERLALRQREEENQPDPQRQEDLDSLEPVMAEQIQHP